ncbi:MAG: tRNA (N6-threonylcarbamoyladenosine(37)-N6)-methyltransferase TrmO [Oliverpabstia sp.]
MENKNHTEHQKETFMRPIAHIHSNFPSKFGIPRQSGIVTSLKSTIVFEPEFRNPEALRGLEEFSHIWLIWEFSQSARSSWSATVRPPRLGGNERKGVFATRSPFRPNPIGLSCVHLDSIEWDTPQGAILHVSGADLMDKTPIYDIKPYIPYADCHPNATGSFAQQHKDDVLSVEISDHWMALIPEEHRDAVIGILEQDPRPAYHHDENRIYGFLYAGMEIKFQVHGNTATIYAIEKM